MILVGSVYITMCDLVVALDYKIDLASRAGCNIWRFVNLIMFKRVLYYTRERERLCGRERERASMDVMQKLCLTMKPHVTVRFSGLSVQTGFSTNGDKQSDG